MTTPHSIYRQAGPTLPERMLDLGSIREANEHLERIAGVSRRLGRTVQWGADMATSRRVLFVRCPLIGDVEWYVERTPEGDA